MDITKSCQDAPLLAVGRNGIWLFRVSARGSNDAVKLHKGHESI